MKRLTFAILLLFCVATAASAARVTFSGFVAQGAYNAPGLTGVTTSGITIR